MVYFKAIGKPEIIATRTLFIDLPPRDMDLEPRFDVVTPWGREFTGNFFEAHQLMWVSVKRGVVTQDQIQVVPR